MHEFEIFILLMSAAILLVSLSQKFQLPYPLALVLGGAAIGFIPGLNSIHFDPNVILVIVIPPILFYAAFWMSLREFNQNLRSIISLAVGLVIVTTLIIGATIKWLIPDIPWALAFAFGAIVSPPDAAAATAVLKRFRIASRLMAILEGESLINDAAALVLYRMAVVALLSGVFSFGEASIQFAMVAVGGIVLGAGTGFLIYFLSRRFLEPVVGVMFSFVTPYIIYIVADFMGFSGVLAVVTAGLVGTRMLIQHHSSLRRILTVTPWDIFIIFLNCFVFILIGLQLKAIIGEMSFGRMALYTGYGLLITFVMILVRMAWVCSEHAFAYIKARQNPERQAQARQLMRQMAILGWSGMRGIVSLAAVLALPLTLSDGQPIERRDDVIFITFTVIFFTLFIPGLSLERLLRLLNITQNPGPHGSLKIRDEMTKAAQEEITRMLNLGHLDDEEASFLNNYFAARHRILEIATSSESKSANLETAKITLIGIQRQTLLKMWKNHEVEDNVLKHLEHELDVEETNAARAELQ